MADRSNKPLGLLAVAATDCSTGSLEALFC
jgi:hypothetical protein